MPFGAYKVNAWGGNLNDAPVLPNGLQVSNNSLALTFGSPLVDVNTINGYNTVSIVGYNNSRIYAMASYEDGNYFVSFNNTNTSLTVLTLGPGIKTYNCVSALSGNSIGPGTSNMLVVTSGITATVDVATLYSYSSTNWVNSTGINQNESNASPSAYTSSFVSTALTCGFNTSDSGQARSISIGYRTASATQQIATNLFSSTAVATRQINFLVAVGTQNYNIENGIKITTFTSSNTDIRATWLGFKSDNTLRIGALLFVGTTSPTTAGNFYNPGITYSNKTAMIKPIWDDFNNNINLGVLLHSDQYLRIIKYSSWTNTGATITGSRDFLISDNPNTWYRLCNTGINGLGALVYFDPYNAPAFKIRFFSIDSSGTVLTLGNPIDLASNSVGDMAVMNADVKWTPWGFVVGIYATNNVNNIRYFNSVLWPVNKPNIDTNATISYYPTSSSAVNYLSNTQAKFGNSSLRLGFVSPGARVNSTNTTTWTDYNIGTTGDFTVECWINPTTFSGTTGTAAYAWRWGLFNYGIQFNVNGGVNRISLLWNNVAYQGPNVSTGTWYHTALVRTSGTIYLYVNGTRYAGPTGDVTDMGLGYNVFSVTQTGYACYVDEFRISDVARYTAATITPPTSAFTYDTNTKCLYHFNSNQPGSINFGNIVDDWGQGYPG